MELHTGHLGAGLDLMEERKSVGIDSGTGSRSRKDITVAELT